MTLKTKRFYKVSRGVQTAIVVNKRFLRGSLLVGHAHQPKNRRDPRKQAIKSHNPSLLAALAVNDVSPAQAGLHETDTGSEQ
ncbi:hypothetical protein [Bosea sp. (in: a-proteobacteria)]|uniref:hypothetical protein n=1 Tax=Bosea sp. (in: a-proteobacteria) TaxID=1871050 RepID=UPI002DDD442E|nr:hypothetical protein [Bosea sp. (in: a-proteobacteria)]HEV2507967.1 hypothetical protein [Bosea sp. (in: a-proteobacteria)]